MVIKREVADEEPEPHLCNNEYFEEDVKEELEDMDQDPIMTNDVSLTPHCEDWVKLEYEDLHLHTIGFESKEELVDDWSFKDQETKVEWTNPGYSMALTSWIMEVETFMDPKDLRVLEDSFQEMWEERIVEIADY